MSQRIQATYLEDGYWARSARSNRGLTGWYRDLTVGEAKRFQGYETIYALDGAGNVREVRLNGRPKTWKRSPGCELSLKYGLYDYFRVGNKQLQDGCPIGDSSTRIVVPVKQPFAPETPPEIVLDWVLENELAAIV